MTMQNRLLRRLWPVSLVFIIPVLPDSSHLALFTQYDTYILVAYHIYSVPVKALRQ